MILLMMLQTDIWMFPYADYEQYKIGHELCDFDDNGIMETVIVHYDMNKNGVVDASGYFIIHAMKDGDVYSVKPFAYILGIDHNEDNCYDKVLVDDDLDGRFDQVQRYECN